jgi:hypothetical protein
MKMPKVTIIGQNHLFPWKLGDEPICEEFKPMPEKLHKIVLDKVQYICKLTPRKLTATKYSLTVTLPTISTLDELLSN